MRKRILAFLLALTMLFVLIGCQQSEQPQTPNNPQTSGSSGTPENQPQQTDTKQLSGEISVIHWYDESSEGMIARRGEEFTALYPDVTVKSNFLPFAEVRSQIIANSAAGQADDVLGVSPQMTSEYVGLGILEPLDTYFEDEGFNISDYIQATIRKIDGHYYILPYAASEQGMFYNLGMFERKGLEVPKTWQEYRDVAPKLTDPQKNEYAYTFYMNDISAANGSSVTLLPWIYASDGNLLDENNHPQFNTDNKVIAGVYELLKWTEDNGYANPGWATRAEVQNTEEFSQDRIAMMAGSVNQMNVLMERNPDLNITVDAAPTMTGNETSYAAYVGWQFGMWSGSKNKEAAWEFIKYLVSPEAQLKTCEETGSLPANYKTDLSEIKKQSDSVAKQIAYLENYEMREEAMMMPVYTDSRVQWTAETSAYISGKQDLDTTLNNITDKWIELNGWDK